MSDLFTAEEPQEDEFKLDGSMIGPWIRCKHCFLSMADWHPEDENGIAWAVQLNRVDDEWICTRCEKKHTKST